MSTGQEILNGAYGHSKKNQPGEIASEATELRLVLVKALRGLFMFGTRFGPAFFGKENNQPSSSGAWPVPSDVEMLFRLENATDGTRAVIVPFTDRGIAAPTPAVYHFGQALHPAGNTNDPDTADALTFFYAKQADDPGDLSTELDSLWPEEYDKLLELEVAIYLALKDGRNQEVQQLKEDRDVWAVRFAAHVEHYAPATMGRFEGTDLLNPDSEIAPGAFLAGGSERFGAG